MLFFPLNFTYSTTCFCAPPGVRVPQVEDTGLERRVRSELLVLCGFLQKIPHQVKRHENTTVQYICMSYL
jgi:hypothetical protein